MTDCADMLTALAMAIENRGITNVNETFTFNQAQREWIATALRHEAERLRIVKDADAWLREPQYQGIVVLDPDGWDRKNYQQSWQEQITEDEFKRRLMCSTLLRHEAEHLRASRTYQAMFGPSKPSQAGTGSLYPPDWPRCACGQPVLDGHLTCGDVACNESAARRSP